MFLQKPLTLTFTDVQNIAGTLTGLGHSRLHITHGTFGEAAHISVPQILAGFEHVSKTLAHPDDTFVIALRSDESILRTQFSELLRHVALKENQYQRSDRVAAALQAQHPTRDIVVSFYDKTPEKLYAELNKSCDTVVSIHEWDCSGPASPRLLVYTPSKDEEYIFATAKYDTVSTRHLINENGELVFPLAASLQYLGLKAGVETHKNQDQKLII